MNTSLPELLDVANSVIDLGERYVRSHPPSTVTAKGDRDMVTDVDLAVERAIRLALHTHTPQLPVLGEEEGGQDAGTRWVLDPVDGTANFARGMPLNGISLALIHKDQPVLGVISLPFLNHRYWAATGLGAWRDGQPITAAATTDISQAIVAIGDYGTGPYAEPRNQAALALHAYLAPRVQRIRMLGSAAVDLAWVADAGLDASITLSNYAWDMAAGAVIAREAGAVVVDIDGSAHRATSRFTIAAAPDLREHILTAVQHATTVLTGSPGGRPC
ncbi:MAG: inositol monophosphatase family protein [Actinobacteria bacterium]|nr:inositol monophosphatase family protein [Actinomycetota bacterium]MBI3687420.1 inositol monophosphatase family protein [Actinomycetota bacterium]